MQLKSLIPYVKHIFPKRVSIALVLTVFILGMGMGISLSQIFKEHTTTLAIIAIVLSWSGSGVGIYKLFSEYFKDKREQENKPRLGYSRTYKHGSNYFLEVYMISGEGMAEGCIGNYTINNEMENVPTVWEHSERREYDIGPPIGLLLFGIEDKSILFPSAHGFQSYGCAKNSRLLDDFIDKTIAVDIYTRKGIPPARYTRKIADIIYLLDLFYLI